MNKNERLYNDVRDYLIKKNKIDYKHTRFHLNRETVKAYFLNNTGNNIRYIKISHIINGKDVYLKEYYNLKNLNTLEVELVKHTNYTPELSYLHIFYMINEDKYYSFDLSTEYNYLYTNNQKIHFIFGPRDCNQFNQKFKKIITYMILILTIIALIIFYYIKINFCQV